MTIREIAPRINAHLKRLESEHPKTDTGIIRFWHPWAWATGSRLGIKYVEFQCAQFLTKEQAIAYLAWLDEGGDGKHWELVTSAKPTL